MRIDTTNRTTGVNRSGTARSASGMAFVPTGAETPTQIAAAAPVASSAGIEAILALQAVDSALEGKRKTVQRATSMLDTLEEIKADLLVGRISLERLDRLSTMLGQMREHSLPGLDAVLDDIELRVQVELAKFGRFPVV